jgi:uncharacterized membrane-anchored protein
MATRPITRPDDETPLKGLHFNRLADRIENMGDALDRIEKNTSGLATIAYVDQKADQLYKKITAERDIAKEKHDKLDAEKALKDKRMKVEIIIALGISLLGLIPSIIALIMNGGSK